jgi:Uma2 family endonuclease
MAGNGQQILDPMSLQPNTRYTIHEYLELEAATPEKHEFLDGEIFAMGGASAAHNLTVLNVGGELRQQLRGKSCIAYPSDLRVKVAPTGLYTYPDLTVVCGKPEFEQPGDTLVNPAVLIEVLSDSSEAYDRGKKFEQYRTLVSLSDYLLIAQDKALVEHYNRQSGGRWLLSTANALSERIEIASIGCNLALAEVYLNVDGIAQPPSP